MIEPADQVLRSMTTDGAFRVITVVATETVRGAVQAQNVQGATARWLGELMIGAVLVREAMSPDRRVQILIKNELGRTQMVADAHPAGWNRGIVNPGAAERPDMSHNSVLEVLYTLPNDVLQQGIVQLPDQSDVSAGLMAYMQESEQIVSMIAVRTIVDNETMVRAAGGYMVQLLPDASREALEAMTLAISGFTELDSVLSLDGLDARILRNRLLSAIPAEDMTNTYLCFGCNCDRERVLAGLASLPDEDIREMLERDESVEVHCEACGTCYRIADEELQSMLRSPRDPDIESRQN